MVLWQEKKGNISMTDTKRLVPQPEPRRGQCQAYTYGYETSYDFRKKELDRRADVLGWDVNKCQNMATHRIKGTDFCTNHAAKTALKIVIGEYPDQPEEPDHD